MSSGRVWAVAVRVVRQFRRDPRTLALVIVVPLAVTLLVGYLLRESRTQPSIAVVVPDASHDSVEDAIAQRLASAGFKVDRVCCAASALASLRNGTWDAVLEVVRGDGGRLRLTVEGSNPTGTRAVVRAVEQVARALPPQALLESALPAAASSGATPVGVEYLHGGPEFDSVDFQAPGFIGFFAFFFVFVLTTVSFLRERTAGTLERLMVTPVSRVEVVLGYMLGFGLVAIAQAVVILSAAILVLRIHYEGHLALVFLLVITLVVASVNLGIFLSTFARTELQAVQFIPVVLVPQGLISGLLWPVENLPGWLQVVAKALPLTYSTDALRAVMLRGEGFGDSGFVLDLAVLWGFAAAFVLLGARTIRRRAG